MTQAADGADVGCQDLEAPSRGEPQHPPDQGDINAVAAAASIRPFALCS